jgi:hypothetical protein
MSAAEHLREAIDVGCTRDDHDHVADHRAEVLAEAKTEVVAWLAKKATEQSTWDASVLASKVDRGAVRAFLDTGHYRDAMDAHRAEVLREAADLIEAWQHDADDAAALDHGALTATETAAHIAVHRMARRLRETAGKDTSSAQAPAGESTQPAPDADEVMSAVRACLADFNFGMYGIDVDGPDPSWVGDLASTITGALDSQPTPATEYAHWTAITTALNTAAQAGIHIGIDINGSALTDHSDRAITYDSTTEQWVVVCNDCDRTLHVCGHCPHCDTCYDCGTCSRTGCTCRCEVSRG